jgi:hypothetical protein
MEPTPTPAPEDEEHDPFCICDPCMAERETIDPAQLAHVARVLTQHGTPTPAPEETDAHPFDCDCMGCRMAQYPADVHDWTCPDCNAPIEWGKAFCSDCTQVRIAAKAQVETASHIVARLRLKSLGIATAALLFLSVTTHSACYQAGTTGEGFPVITCPLEGATYVVDMDGTDGSRGAENDGRWIRIS